MSDFLLTFEGPQLTILSISLKKCTNEKAFLKKMNESYKVLISSHVISNLYVIVFSKMN